MSFDQKNIVLFRNKVWNKFSISLNLSGALNIFKHKVKEHFSEKLKNKEQDFVTY